MSLFSKQSALDKKLKQLEVLSYLRQELIESQPFTPRKEYLKQLNWYNAAIAEVQRRPRYES